jgi:hypothetical protein
VDLDYSIYVQEFGPNGSKTGYAPVVLEATNCTFGPDVKPQVTAVGNDGAYVLAWSGANSATTNDSSVFVQRFNANGTTNGAVTKLDAAAGVNSDTSMNADTTPQVSAVGAAGAYVVTWVGIDGPVATNYKKIYFQQFNADGSTTAASSLALGNIGTWATGASSGRSSSPVAAPMSFSLRARVTTRASAWLTSRFQLPTVDSSDFCTAAKLLPMMRIES